MVRRKKKGFWAGIRHWWHKQGRINMKAEILHNYEIIYGYVPQSYAKLSLAKLRAKWAKDEPKYGPIVRKHRKLEAEEFELDLREAEIRRRESELYKR